MLQQSVLAFATPAFLFLTGYLINIRKDVKTFCRYIVRLGVMYVVMEGAYLVMSHFLPVRDGIEELTVSCLLRHLVATPLGPYWYLHTMVICGAAYYAVQRACERWHIHGVVMLTTLLLLAVAYTTPALNIVAVLSYFAGVAAKNSGKPLEQMLQASWFGIPLMAATFTYGMVCDNGFATQESVYSVVMGLGFLSAVVWSDSRWPRGVKTLLNYTGRNTLPIYLFHPLFTIMSKKLLAQLLAVDSSTTLFCVVTIFLAVAGSLLIGRISDAVGASILLGQKRLLR